jgi:alpha/beta superfamily hydrolase
MPDIFIGDNPRIEAVYEETPSGICAIITHPHSQMGGNMNNNVVMAAWNTVLEKGFSALRFNFRGVGRSEGVFDNGIGEISDLAAVVEYVECPAIIIGYSFGAWVAANFLNEVDLPCIFISPPTGMFSFPSMKEYSVWSVVGSQDQFCNHAALTRIMDKKRVTVIGGADHFWFGSENKLKPYLDKKLELIRSISY